MNRRCLRGETFSFTFRFIRTIITVNSDIFLNLKMLACENVGLWVKDSVEFFQIFRSKFGKFPKSQCSMLGKVFQFTRHKVDMFSIFVGFSIFNSLRGIFNRSTKCSWEISKLDQKFEKQPQNPWPKNYFYADLFELENVPKLVRDFFI